MKDTAAVGRRFVEWGLEQRYYDASTALILDSEDMTPIGGAQNTTLTGAYKRAGATKATIVTTLLAQPTVCANTGVLKHVGVFRVKARVQATLGATSIAEKVHVRLSYQDGEGPLRANAWQSPPVGGALVEVDLGEITVTPAVAGTQKWLGQIEAYSGNAPGADVLHIDYLVFIPVAEGYGKARGATSSAPGTVLGFDNFTTGTLSGNLNGRTAPTGNSWATSGAGADWTVSLREVKNTIAENTIRNGVLGPAIGNCAVSANCESPGEGPGEVGFLIRYVDASNYAVLRIKESLIKLAVVVAGVETVLAEESHRSGARCYGKLTATIDGVIVGSYLEGVPGNFAVALRGSHASLRTGGALASGKGGIFVHAGAGKTQKSSFAELEVSEISAVPYCVQPSRSMEVHSDSTITYDSTGTYTGPPPEYRGSRFYVPQDGEANRTSRVLVKADRNDLEAADEQTIADAFTAEVRVTPRYSVIPR